MPASPRQDTASFGYRDVPRAEKQGLVGDVFRSVASRYDVMNDVMSGGVHRIWKAAMIDWLAPRPGMALLDVAGGTGDIAFRFLNKANRKAEEKNASPASVTLADINPAMLAEGAARAAERPDRDQITIACANAENLPFPDSSFDAYTIAFGIRNVTNIDAALREARRVLKPGGRFLCLEFSHATTDMLQRVYDAYSFNVIPRMGALIANDRESYQYLVESIRKFPDQAAFAKRIGEAGLKRVKVRNMTGGVAALHSGWRV